jgi:hypothetical protein
MPAASAGGQAPFRLAGHDRGQGQESPGWALCRTAWSELIEERAEVAGPSGAAQGLGAHN